ncbi:MAG TPA: futalosine hydrolase [Bacteroidales bacterium]
MSVKLLLVTATSSEAEVLKNISGMISVPGGYHYGNYEINLLIAGVGSISTAWSLQQWISMNSKPDIAINTGIAGTYRDELIIGDVVLPVTDCFADAGIEDGANFLTLAEAGLMSANEFPFREGRLYSDNMYTNKIKSILKPVNAITVNTVTGSESSREKLVKKFNPDIETMEGATFFYICSREKIPFLALRSISNKVEARNKSNWNIALALNNLSEKLIEVMISLQ